MGTKSSFSLFGIPMGDETTTEQWCGGFGGSCMAKILDSDGNEIEPAQWEPALCFMTKSVCGKEEDVRAALNFTALGGKVVASLPCLPHTGQPNTTMCNIVNAPGIDPLNLQARIIDPPMELTAQAQKEKDEGIKKGERMINTMLLGSIVWNAIQGIMCIGFSAMCYRRRALAEKARLAHSPNAAIGNPTILSVGRSAEKAAVEVAV